MTEPDASSHKAAEHWMARAIALASHSVGLASPNPPVGCVIVQGENVVGEGFHVYDSLDHAEIVALHQAGSRALGATAYVTLEPCPHHGRTGPCTEALIAAGITRVVVATLDPNPLVSGKGVERLQSAGLAVSVGVLEASARLITESFAHFIRKRRPFVTLKSGMTLDGRIAPSPPMPTEHGSAPQSGSQSVIRPGTPGASGGITWITSDRSRAVVQQMRHSVDAVITGIGTILSDDPLLTDRSGRPRRRPLLRVILDSALRLRPNAQIVRSANEDVLVFCTSHIGDRFRSLEALGVRIEHIEPAPNSSRVSLTRVLERLGELDITSAMLEAGPQINASAFNQHVVDKLFLFYAPTLFGDSAVPLVHNIQQTLDGQPLPPPRLNKIKLHHFGEDFGVEGYLHDPWEDIPTSI